MKNKKSILKLGALILLGLIIVAADHMEAPAIDGTKNDITDYYAFQAANPSNIVLAANVQGMLSPSETATASFSQNSLLEFNIDTDNDNVEDYIIQAIKQGDKMYFFGPYVPASTGKVSTINTNATQSEVEITSYGVNAIIGNNAGMSFFAGPRDDPFFFDFSQFEEILAGTATGFNNPGTDSFAGTNVMSVVIEVPKSMIGSTGTVNTWVETKVR